MKRLILFVALLGCTDDPTRVSLKLTEYKDVAIVSLDGVPSDLMASPPAEVREDCPAVWWAACEATMPGVVRVGTAYLVQKEADGTKWTSCRNVLCAKTSVPAE